MQLQNNKCYITWKRIVKFPDIAGLFNMCLCFGAPHLLFVLHMYTTNINGALHLKMLVVKFIIIKLNFKSTMRLPDLKTIGHLDVRAICLPDMPVIFRFSGFDKQPLLSADPEHCK